MKFVLRVTLDFPAIVGCTQSLRPAGGSAGQANASYLLITVSDDGQVEELASMLLGQDGVHSCSVGPSQLIIYCQVVR